MQQSAVNREVCCEDLVTNTCLLLYDPVLRFQVASEQTKGSERAASTLVV